MKKISLSIILLFGIVVSVSAFSEYDAKIIVNRFYENLKIIANGVYPGGEPTNDFVVARNDALSLCYENDINFPNEFAEFNFGTSDHFLRVETYITRLFDFSIQKSPKIDAKILRVQALEEIKFRKSENSKNFYRVYVKKTISVGRSNMKEYTDTVLINAESMKITRISNESGGGAGESVISLRGKAAQLFAEKRYDEAFDVYLRVVQKDPKQGDAYYRLGLMAYLVRECKYRYPSGKERRRAAYNYIEKATHYGDFNIRENAERVLYYMKYGPV